MDAPDLDQYMQKLKNPAIVDYFSAYPGLEGLVVAQNPNDANHLNYSFDKKQALKELTDLMKSATRPFEFVFQSKLSSMYHKLWLDSNGSPVMLETYNIDANEKPTELKDIIYVGKGSVIVLHYKENFKAPKNFWEDLNNIVHIEIDDIGVYQKQLDDSFKYYKSNQNPPSHRARKSYAAQIMRAGHQLPLFARRKNGKHKHPQKIPAKRGN
ncbi:hypothetical protein HYX03_03895 [Candidatus Woesearchaeota archaeon]|nr:hypothetical protein [Candidatus Woesearchaeota archaeon]